MRPQERERQIERPPAACERSQRDVFPAAQRPGRGGAGDERGRSRDHHGQDSGRDGGLARGGDGQSERRDRDRKQRGEPEPAAPRGEEAPRGQRGRRGKGGEEVGRELAVGEREEDEDDREPDHEEERLGLSPAGPAQPPEEEAERGEKARDEDHDEVVDRPGAVRDRRREPLEVLVDEEEVQEPGHPLLGEDQPRQREREEHRRGGSEEKGCERAAPSRRERPEEEDASRQHDPDEPLGEKGPRGERSRQGGEDEPGPPCRFRAQRREAAEHGRREEEGQHAVRQVQAREGEGERSDEKEDRRDETGAPSPETADGEPHEQERAEPRQTRHEPRREARVAEDFHRRGVGPVEERRLFEVGHAVQARNDEIVRRQHLARDLRVPWLVRLREPGARRVEPDGEKQQRESGQESRAAGIAHRAQCNQLV